MEFKRVVITGLGTLNPLGNNVEEYWENLMNGVSGSNLISGAELIKSFDTTHFKTKFACQLKNFNVLEHLDRKESRKLDPYSQYALVAAKEAMDDSKIDLESVNKDRFGVIWASGIGGIQTFFQEVKSFVERDCIPRFNPFLIPKMIADIASGHISMKYGLRGINYSTTSACASSTHSLINAFTYIRIGKADMIISGGSEAAINEVGVGGFSAMHAISSNNDEYKTASRPFDKTRDGFVMGEGAGALILEEYEHAKKRGAKIYAEIIGGGMSADAHHLTAPHPEGKGAILVMKNAIEDAGITTKDIDYINVHGTATPLGDISETMAIKTLFKDEAYKLNISSTKSMTGHLLGAAGAVETMACLFAINKGIVPPTINFSQEDDRIDNKLNLTVNKKQKRDVKIALSNTFGFGGHNASVIVKKIS